MTTSRPSGAITTSPTTSWRSSPDHARMIILGLDPGLGTTGWGLIRAEGNRLSHIANGQLKTASAQAAPGAARPSRRQLEALMTDRPADGAAVEEVFVNKNPQSTLKLGQARGVVLMFAARSGLDGRRICRAAGQESGGRQRQCGKGAGPRDGPAAAARSRHRRARRRRRAGRRNHPRASSGERAPHPLSVVAQ